MATIQIKDQKVGEDLPKTVGELMERIDTLQIRKVIYEHMLEHLGSFLSTDSYQPDKGIKAPNGGAVSEDQIATVCEEMEETIGEVSSEIDRLKQQGIAPAQQEENSGKKQRGKKKDAKQQTTDEEEGGAGE